MELRLSLPATKSADPPEDKIGDLSIMVFNSAGWLEESFYYSSLPEGISLRLVSGAEFTIAACANARREMKASSLEELGKIRWYMAYPDEYSEGMPLVAVQRVIPKADNPVLEIGLERLMAKVSLRMDRRDLSEEVSIKVRSVQIGSCPRSALLFAENACRGSEDVFDQGFVKAWGDADILNMDASPGVSGYISLYMMENLQEEGPAGCSFVEVKAEYHSPHLHTPPGQYLIYRFYLLDEDGRYGARRGTEQKYTIHPVGDGLGGEGWYMDESALVED